MVRRRAKGALLLSAALLLAGCTVNFGDPTEPSPTSAQTPSPAPTASPTPSPTPLPDGEDLAAAVVRVVAVDADGIECHWGSGTIVDPSGVILTNFHVVEYDPTRSCAYASLVIETTTSSDAPPEPAYAAAVYAFDAEKDIAVLRVTGDLDGLPVTDPLPSVALGDSDALEIGAPLRIIGYPATGGETITLTDGSVSGFLDGRGIAAQRAWIKTAAAITGGNSGGAGFNSTGELVGIPTQVTAGDDALSIDCRRLSDTNEDGYIDGEDSCVPVGGYLNSLRPVNLALTLLQQARTASAPIPLADLSYGQDVVPAEADADAWDLRFGTGTDGLELTGEAVAFPTGTGQLCAGFSYEGWQPGGVYDLHWLLDGEQQDVHSLIAQRWSGDSSGQWWACTAGSGTLPNGLWEFAVFYESDEPAVRDGVFVGDEYPLAEVEVVNGASVPLCGVALSPSRSSTWGQNDADPDLVLQPGQSVFLDVAAAEYDAAGQGCEDEGFVAESYGIDIADGAVVTLVDADLG